MHTWFLICSAAENLSRDAEINVFVHLRIRVGDFGKAKFWGRGVGRPCLHFICLFALFCCPVFIGRLQFFCELPVSVFCSVSFRLIFLTSVQVLFGIFRACFLLFVLGFRCFFSFWLMHLGSFLKDLLLFKIINIFICLTLYFCSFFPSFTSFFFLFWLYLQHMEVPGPGTESKPQPQHMPQLWQCCILNPLHQAWDWTQATSEVVLDP